MNKVEHFNFLMGFLRCAIDIFEYKGNWRRARDSNPRAPRRAASFQDWCIQPLYQLSTIGSSGKRSDHQH